MVNPPKHTPPSKKLNRTSVKLKAELADLSTLIMDKLEFLEVSRKGLSNLQVLLIELEVRIAAKYVTQGSYRSWNSWKVLEFPKMIFPA